MSHGPSTASEKWVEIYKYLQCLKLMVAQKIHWAGPLKFDPGQVEIMIDYIRREIVWINISGWLR